MSSVGLGSSMGGCLQSTGRLPVLVKVTSGDRLRFHVNPALSVLGSDIPGRKVEIYCLLMLPGFRLRCSAELLAACSLLGSENLQGGAPAGHPGHPSWAGGAWPHRDQAGFPSCGGREPSPRPPCLSTHTC